MKHLSLTVCLLLTTTASAEEPTIWRGQVGGNLHVLDQSVGTTDTRTYGVGAGGSFYLRDLANDASTPLALLSFVQHPGSITLDAVANTLQVRRPGISPTTTSQTYDLSSAANVYPWQDTGLSAGAGFNQRNSDNVGEGYFHVGADHYFSRDFRLSLQYVFNRSGSAILGGAPSELKSWAADGGKLGATFLFAHDFVSLIPTIQIGQVRGSYNDGDVAGLYYTATLDAALYLGRRFSVGLTPELGAQNQIAASNRQARASSRYTHMKATAHARWYALDSLYLTAQLSSDIRFYGLQESVTAPPQPSMWTSTALLGVGGTL